MKNCEGVLPQFYQTLPRVCFCHW